MKIFKYRNKMFLCQNYVFWCKKRKEGKCCIAVVPIVNCHWFWFIKFTSAGLRCGEYGVCKILIWFDLLELIFTWNGYYTSTEYFPWAYFLLNWKLKFERKLKIICFQKFPNWKTAPCDISGQATRKSGDI